MSRSRLIALLLALVTLVVFLPTTRFAFINYDDNDYVTANPPVQAGVSWAGVKWAFTTMHANNWHPVTWISHMADCSLFGLNPGARARLDPSPAGTRVRGLIDPRSTRKTREVFPFEASPAA